MDITTEIEKLNRHFKVDYSRRPIGLWEGQHVCIYADGVDRGYEYSCLKNLRIWKAGYGNDTRIIDHLWCSNNFIVGTCSNPDTAFITGMAKVIRYRRKDGSVDYGLEPISYRELDTFNAAVKRHVGKPEIMSGILKTARKMFMDDRLLYTPSYSWTSLKATLDSCIEICDRTNKKNEEYRLNAYLTNAFKNKPRKHTWNTL